ncbi:hypothetical protein STPYR_10531 [uncultured Stenotrophomonas sp.]|uniref:Uncharacterized protein n=1 Tax=uncultured Stenotrophomonas sp. TaxID=165438 RepID=A0A1Y5Q027_9GAMM|nr:hypothetical protein STPYR_10531 [uncultured Stenotrophomonas sp.]
MNPMRLRMKLARRLRQLLPPGLAGRVRLPQAETGWCGSPLAGLALGTGGARGGIRLELDHVLAAAIRQHGDGGLPSADVGNPEWSRWQPLGRRQLRFRAISPQSRRVLLLDALRGQLWLLWCEPAPAGHRLRY